MIILRIHISVHLCCELRARVHSFESNLVSGHRSSRLVAALVSEVITQRRRRCRETFSFWDMFSVWMDLILKNL